jgi:RND family efflux transporter MFP subunit
MKRIVTILALAAGGALLSGCRKAVTFPKLERPVTVAAVETRSAERARRYSANIEPWSQVDLTFRIAGYVTGIHQVRGADGRLRNLQEGDFVSRGTVLARLRESDYMARLNQVRAQLEEANSGSESARAQLAEAEANLEQSRRDAERAKNLFGTQSLTRVDYDAAQTKLELSAARVTNARAALDSMKAKIGMVRAAIAETELQLVDCSVRAPFDGLVLHRNVEIGSLASPGGRIFVLADVSSVKAAFGVPDRVVETLSPGDSLAVTTEALRGAELRGRITSISPSADTSSRVFEVELQIPNDKRALKAGMIATVSVPVEKDAAPQTESGTPVIPLTAVVKASGSEGGYSVFVVEGGTAGTGSSIARARSVKLGEVYGNKIAVAEGLRLEERVVSGGASLLTDGDAVRVMP